MVNGYQKRDCPIYSTGEALYGRSGALTDNDDRGRDERADEEAEHEYADDDAEPLDEVHVGYLDRLRRPHPEDHRYPRVSREGGRGLARLQLLGK